MGVSELVLQTPSLGLGLGGWCLITFRRGVRAALRSLASPHPHPRGPCFSTSRRGGNRRKWA